MPDEKACRVSAGGVYAPRKGQSMMSEAVAVVGYYQHQGECVCVWREPNQYD